MAARKTGITWDAISGELGEDYRKNAAKVFIAHQGQKILVEGEDGTMVDTGQVVTIRNFSRKFGFSKSNLSRWVTDYTKGKVADEDRANPMVALAPFLDQVRAAEGRPVLKGDERLDPKNYTTQEKAVARLAKAFLGWDEDIDTTPEGSSEKAAATAEDIRLAILALEAVLAPYVEDVPEAVTNTATVYFGSLNTVAA